jgi:putative addiction module killer protein
MRQKEEMEPKVRILEKYVTEKGKCPFDDWFGRLKDIKSHMVIDARLTRLRQGQMGTFRSVGHGVKELKIDYGPGYRVYFGEDGDTLVVLLCGGDKGSQGRDIKKAQEYWADYLR